MSYDYKTIKPNLFTEEGQVLFLKIRDNTNRLLKQAGAVRLQEAAMNNSGSSWDMLACMDRLVELGELREIPTDGVAQHRIFVSRIEL